MRHDSAAQQLRLFEAISTTTPDFLYVFDLQGRFVYANRRLLEVWGVTLEQAVGKSLYELGYPQWHADMHMAEIRQVIETGQPIKGEVAFTGGSGISGVYEYIFSPVFGSDGKIEVIAGTTRDVSDRRRAEEKSRIILESITDSFFSVDAEWRFSYANPQAEHVLFRQPGDLIGKVIWEVYPELEGSEFGEVYRRVATKRLPESFTAFYAEHQRWYDVHAYPAADGGLSIYFRDATGQMQAQLQLQRSSETFYNLIQNNPFGVYIVDADFRLRQVSLGAQKVFANVQPLLDRDFPEVMHILWPEPFASEVINRFRHTLETGEPFVSPGTVEQRQDIADVEAYDWRIERVLLPDGRPGVVCYFYDLSERQRWEAALTASEARFRTLFESMDEGFCVIEMLYDDAGRAVDYRFIETNPTFYKHTGLHQAVGRTMREMVPDHDAHWFEIYGEVAATGTPRRFTNQARAMGRWFEVFAFRFGDPGSHRVAVLFTDVTERKNAEANRERLLESERTARTEAERASRMKDEFLATLSHELRTPLNAILGWAQILLIGGKDREELVEGLQTIERNARVQTQIIEDLLDMSRIISGKIRLDVQRLSLPTVVQAAVETVRPAAEAKGVRLQVILDPLAGPVSGDPNRLQQVFWNLLTNAVKFTPRGGRVQILLERVNWHVEVSVIDTGEGISAEFLPYVFDRFRQADASITRKHGGLGIGLAIVKQLVELHGGSIRVNSPGESQGASFVVALPLTIVHVEPQPLDERRHPTSASVPLMPDICQRVARLKVLVVDDEPDARMLVKRLLEGCDAIVSVAASADEAFAQLLADPPDILVSDIGMPGEDGYAFIKRVRALESERGGDIPAIALTAYARAEDRMNAVMAGFQLHIAKPVEPVELVTMIAALAKSRREALHGNQP